MYISRLFSILFIFIYCFSFDLASAQSKDKESSHIVKAGESLYRISRMYGLTVSQLKNLNPSVQGGIQVGQTLVVREENQKKTTGIKEHIVGAGETLYSICRQYNLSLKDLKSINKLTGNSLNKGDVLLLPNQEKDSTIISKPIKAKGSEYIVKSGDTFYSIAKSHSITLDELYRLNQLLSNHKLSVGEKLILGVSNDLETKKIQVKSKKEVKKKKIEPIILNDLSISVGKSVDKNGKVHEVGVAQLIVGTEKSNKYLALHKSAPAGTVIQVRNTMNDLSLFVRVIGVIPSVETNEKVVIKITKKALDRLGAADAYFPVELTYIPNVKESL